MQDTEGMELVHSEEINGITHMEYYEDENGNKHVEYALWEAQAKAVQRWLNGRNQIVDLRCGYGAGKSYAGARGIIRGAWDLPGSRWLCMAESYSEGWETTYRILLEQLPLYDGEDPESSPLVEEYRNHKEKYVKLVNGSKIILGSAQESDKHKGDEYSGIWADEVALYGTNLWDLSDMLLSRLRADEGPLSMLWTTTTNPTHPHNDYYELAELGNDENGDPCPWDIHTVQANTLENPFLSDAARENLKRTHKHNPEQGLRGGFAAVDGQVYPEFNKSTHVVSSEDVEVVDGWRMYAYDAGYGDARVVLEIGRTAYNQLVIVDEFYEYESLVSDAVEWLESKPSGTIYSEHEPEHMERFRRELEGFVVRKAEKKIDYGIDKVKERLTEDHTDRVGLLVHERCRNTIEEFQNYTNVGGSSEQDHAMDCVRYAVATSSGNVPQTGEESESRTVSVSTSSVPSRINRGDGSSRSRNSKDNRARERERHRRR